MLEETYHPDPKGEKDGEWRIMKFKTDEKYLRKLAALLDVLSWESKVKKQELRMRNPERAKAEEGKTLFVDVAVVAGYFAQLALKALEDELLAKKLSPIYKDLAEESQNFNMYFSTLQRLMAEKHGWRSGLPPDYVERGIERFERRDWIDQAPHYFLQRMDDIEKFMMRRESDENPMYA